MEARTRAFEQKRWYDPAYSGPMSRQEVEDFLSTPDAKWLVKIATVKEDGWPSVVPVWYHWDGEAFYAVGRKRSEWVHDLIREPRCAICIEEKEIPPDGGNRKVLAQCLAEIVEGPVKGPDAKWVEVANKMALRYAGPKGPELLSTSYGWERYLVKLTPRDGKLTTWQGVDWHRRYFDPGERPDLETEAAGRSDG